jgi:hypothetical protein
MISPKLLIMREKPLKQMLPTFLYGPIIAPKEVNKLALVNVKFLKINILLPHVLPDIPNIMILNNLQITMINYAL